MPFYDHIAWFTKEGQAKLTLHYTGQAGRFEWSEHLLKDVGAIEKTWRISDHHPLWVEFSLREH